MVITKGLFKDYGSWQFLSNVKADECAFGFERDRNTGSCCDSKTYNTIFANVKFVGYGLNLLAKLRRRKVYMNKAWRLSSVDDWRKTLHSPMRPSEVDVNLVFMAYEEKYSVQLFLPANTPSRSVEYYFQVVYRILSVSRLRLGGLVGIDDGSLSTFFSLSTIVATNIWSIFSSLIGPSSRGHSRNDLLLWLVWSDTRALMPTRTNNLAKTFLESEGSPVQRTKLTAPANVQHPALSLWGVYVWNCICEVDG